MLDTNIVLSALVFTQGRLAPLREAWQQARCQPLISSATAAELIRALNYTKFKLSDEEQQELLADYLPYCVTVRMPSRLPKTAVCRDPADIPFLQLAIVGKADHLVSGDKDLLSVTRFPRSIITAERLLGMLAKG